MTRKILKGATLASLGLALLSVVTPASAEQSTFFEQGLGTISSPPRSEIRSAFELGEAAMSHRDYEGGISSFSEAIGFNMNNADAYFKRGQCYYYQKHYPQAISDFEYMLKLRPKDAQALLWLGTAQARTGHEDSAIDFYLRAMRIDPRLVKQFQQGTAQGGQKPQAVHAENGGAVGAYEKAIALYLGENPDADTKVVMTTAPFPATAAAGTTAAASGANSDASLFAVKPSVVDNGKPVVQERAEWQTDSSLGEPNFTIAELDAFVKAQPTDAWGFFRRGVFNKHSAHKDVALTDFSEAIRLDPTISRFYLARARLYHEQNQPELSLADVKKAKSIDNTVPKDFHFD